MQTVPKPTQVLDGEGVVQAELLAQLCDELLLRGPIADAERRRTDHRVDRIARDQMEDREHQQRREQQDRNGLHEALRDIPDHVVVVLAAAATRRASCRARSSGGCTLRNVDYVATSLKI